MDRERRISEYEELFDKAEDVASRVEDALDAYDEIQTALQALEDYYTSDAWKEDYDADAEGLLPEHLKRGVLSQDGIDHLLERYYDIRQRIKQK